jgi:hypothetical protein
MLTTILLHPLSSQPPQLSRQVDGCVAGKEEVLLEGVDVVIEAEEKDLSVGVVCTKKDEEPGPCGSATHFLLGMDME